VVSARSEAHAASPSGGDGRGEGDSGTGGSRTAAGAEGPPGADAGADGAPCTACEDSQRPDNGDELLLAALLDGMDAALCAFDADGVVTHWNREAERVLGWTREEAVGRRGLGGWALRPADAAEVEARLLGAMRARGRQVHEFALLTKSGARVLVRIQSSRVVDADGRPSGVYCAFSEAHTQIDLERSVALSESLFETAPWGVVLVDADLRPAAVNSHAASAFRRTRSAMLGRPLGELVGQGLEELESALARVLAEEAPPAPAELWVTLRPGRPEDSGGARTDPSAHSGPSGHPSQTGPSGHSGYSGYAGHPGHGSRGGAGSAADGADSGATRRCWRSGFLRLSSPLAEAPVPLGVAWMFQDVTEAREAEQAAARLRFRDGQLHRAARAAAECEEPMEAVGVHLDFALAGFADHALLDLSLPDESAAYDRDRTEISAATEVTETAETAEAERAEAPAGTDTADGGLTEAPAPRLARAASTPATAAGPVPPAEPGTCWRVPVCYPADHPALQAFERCGSVRASVYGAASAEGWAAARKWPSGTVHGLCTALRSRGRTLGVVTFLRGPSRGPFDRTDAAYAEDVAVRIAAAVDLARLTQRAADR